MLVHFRYLFHYNLISSRLWYRQLLVTVSRKYLFVNRLLILPAINTAFHISYEWVYKMFDKGLLEFVGPFGIVSAIRDALASQYRLQSGLVYHYAGFLFI